MTLPGTDARFELWCDSPAHDERVVLDIFERRTVPLTAEVEVLGEGAAHRWLATYGREELVTDDDRHLSRETSVDSLTQLEGRLRLNYRIDCNCGDNIRARCSWLDAALDKLSGHGVPGVNIPTLRRTINLVK